MDLIIQSPTHLDTNLPALHRVANLVTAKQIVVMSPHCLRCVDMSFNKGHTQTQDAVAHLAEQEKVDVYWASHRKRLSDFKLLVMDMDSTLITIECIDEIADMQGLKPEVAAITEAAMRGEIDFKESLTRRVALLEGLPASALQRVYDERLTLSPGAQTLVHGAQAAGLKILLVSGGFTYFTDRIKATLNLDYAHANQLDIVDGQLNGRVLGEIVDGEGKRNAVQRTCAKLGISLKQIIVIGDGANDLAMMSVAGLSVAFRAKPVVREKADVALNYVGLDGVLNLFERN